MHAMPTPLLTAPPSLPFTALPFLERTELFLYPIAGIALLTPFSILLGFNPSRALLTLYFGGGR
jgi:hypothetical protein